jgi:hypothetical protein
LSSLIVVPWTQNARLEEYYRDPNVFRLMHRGDIKPFHTRQVSVKHCKPFKGDIKAEEIIDPIMLSRFLDDLGVNNNAEIISEIDTSSINSSDDTPPAGSHHSTDSNHTPPGGGNDDNRPRVPPRYDDPDPDFNNPDDPHPGGAEGPKDRGPPVNNPEIERFIDNLEMSEEDKELLRQYCQIKDEMEEFKSFKSSRRLDRIKDFIQSADPAVRERAEFELEQLLSDMKYVEKRGLLDRFSEDYNQLIRGNTSEEDNKEQVKSEDVSLENEPVQADPDPVPADPDLDLIPVDPNDDILSDVGSLLGTEDEDHSSHHSSSNLTWDPRHDLDPIVGPDININLPNLNINIRQPQVNVPNPFARAPRIASSPAGNLRQQQPQATAQNPFARRSKLAKSPEGQARHENVADWLVGRSPQHGPDPPADLGPEDGTPAPVVTRSGRLSKPVAKFDPTVESQLQRDTKSAMRHSLTAADVKGYRTVVAGASKTVTAKKPTVESEKPKHSTVKAKSTYVRASLVPKSPVPSRKSTKTVKTAVPVAEDQSTATVSTPVKDDITRRSTKTARTPP